MKSGHRGEYFPLGCDNHHGIVSKFDQISEKFLFQKSKKSVEKTFPKSKNPRFALTLERLGYFPSYLKKNNEKNPDFHILFGLIVHSND